MCISKQDLAAWCNFLLCTQINTQPPVAQCCDIFWCTRFDTSFGQEHILWLDVGRYIYNSNFVVENMHYE